MLPPNHTPDKSYFKEPYPELKPSNPKDIMGSDKIPLHLWPETASVLGAMALLDGMLKYGRSNFRAVGVRATIYYDAARRHLNKWFEGEDIDPDSGLPHLAHALATIAVLVDAKAAGKLTDDRVIEGGYEELISEMTPHVKRLKALHAGKSPKHYTIDDNQGRPEEPPKEHPLAAPAGFGQGGLLQRIADTKAYYEDMRNQAAPNAA